MAVEKKIYQNSVGVKLIVVVSIPTNPTAEKLLDADDVKLHVKKPGGKEVVWTPNFRSDISGNEDSVNPVALVYITKPGDLDEVGQYKVHSFVSWNSGGSKHFGQMATFKVTKKFEMPS